MFARRSPQCVSWHEHSLQTELAAGMPQQLKAYLKAPEGRYTLVTERQSGSAFNSARITRLTYAELTDGAEKGEYVIFNLMDSLHICRYNQTNKVSHQQLEASLHFGSCRALEPQAS